MVKKYYKFIFIFIFGLFLFIPKDTFAAPSVSSADFNILWTSNVTTGTQNLTYPNYTLGNMQQFGNDPNVLYHIVRWGGGVNFTGTSGEPFVTARVKFRIRAVPSQIQGEIPYFNCMSYSAGMSNLTATKESATAIHDSGGSTTGYDIVCSYSYKSSTPYYQFFGIEGKDGHLAINGTYASASTYFSYDILDLNMTDNSGTQALIIQNQTIINQNDTMINNQNETNNKLGELNDTINNDDVDADSKLEDLFSGKIDYTSTPIIGIFRMPITFLQKILNSINGTCSSFNLGRFEFASYSFVLPCITPSKYLKSNNFDLWTIITGLFNMFMIYNLGVLMFRFYECVTDLKSPLYLLFGRSFDTDDKRNS